MRRLFFDIALVVSILFLPWEVSAVLLVAACFSVRHFYEAFIFGVMADALYSVPSGFHGFPHLGVLFSTGAFLLSAFVRERLAL
jgi:hypothetical protein